MKNLILLPGILSWNRMVTDQELWSEIKKSNDQAFARLFHRYSSRIYSNVYSYIKDREVCEQIVHDIFLSIWANREELEVRSFEAYLTAAARYRVYKHISARKLVPIDYKEELEAYNNTFALNAGYNKMMYHELEAEVNTYISSLPARCRQIFIMSRKESLSNDEIAENLGISKRTVENQVTYALKHLRLLLK